MSLDEVPRAVDRLDAIRAQVEDLRSHAICSINTATEGTSVPELKDGRIPDWRLNQFNEYEWALYELGRARGLEFAAEHVEGALTAPDRAERYREDNEDFAEFLDKQTE